MSDVVVMATEIIDGTDIYRVRMKWQGEESVLIVPIKYGKEDTLKTIEATKAVQLNEAVLNKVKELRHAQLSPSN